MKSKKGLTRLMASLFLAALFLAVLPVKADAATVCKIGKTFAHWRTWLQAIHPAQAVHGCAKSNYKVPSQYLSEAGLSCPASLFLRFHLSRFYLRYPLVHPGKGFFEKFGFMAAPGLSSRSIPTFYGSAFNSSSRNHALSNRQITAVPKTIAA